MCIENILLAAEADGIFGVTMIPNQPQKIKITTEDFHISKLPYPRALKSLHPETRIIEANPCV